MLLSLNVTVLTSPVLAFTVSPAIAKAVSTVVASVVVAVVASVVNSVVTSPPPITTSTVLLDGVELIEASADTEFNVPTSTANVAPSTASTPSALSKWIENNLPLVVNAGRFPVAAEKSLSNTQ